jgi:hypothetical protein
MAKKASSHECYVSDTRPREILKELRKQGRRDIEIFGFGFEVMLADISRITETYLVDKRQGNRYGYVTIEKIRDIHTGKILFDKDR